MSRLWFLAGRQEGKDWVMGMAAMSNEETIPTLLKEALIDRLDPWELVDFLQISIEDIIEAFEYEIVAKVDDLEDLVGIRNTDDED